jgi:Fe-S-cluster containining protein
MSRKTNHKAVAKLDALYALLPTVACKGLCTRACGPLPMTTIEAERMRKADPQRRLPMIREDMTCDYLTPSGRCGVYAVRPLICRVYGTAKNLSCQHGCVPDRWLTPHEFLAIAQAVERAGGPLVFSGVGGLDPDRHDTFLKINPKEGLPPDVVEHYAEVVRCLRALHGGRILAVYPGDGKWIDIDKERP